MIKHKNNVGLLRLVFACLVIVGHAPEMVDGDMLREPLHVLTGTTTLGGLAVVGFFLLSGYLITGSMLRINAIGPYLSSRILRIYPAFVLSFILSTFVLGPLVGALPWEQILQTAAHLIFLKPPVDYPGQFPGMVHYPLLNGAMWTIAYEFRCYLLIAALWATGLLQRRLVMLTLTAATLSLCFASTFHGVEWRLKLIGEWQNLSWFIGDPVPAIKFTAAFLVGASFHSFRDEILPRLTPPAALTSFALALIMIGSDHMAPLALISFGAVALFWLGLKANLGRLQPINDKWDISYGTYLYGWPIAMALRWGFPAITPIELICGTLPLALLAGCASWWGLEKRIKTSPRKIVSASSFETPVVVRH